MIETLTKIIRSRQSIYPVSFTGEIINDDLIDNILRNANEAPTHKQTEPWRFHLVSGESKNAFLQFAQSMYIDTTPYEKFKQAKHDKLKMKFDNSSHILMIGVQTRPDLSLPYWEEVAAVACAVQNIYLSLNALGLGGYWSSPSFIIDKSKEYFRMEENEICLGLFYLGVPKDVIPPKPLKGNYLDKIKRYT